MEGWLDLQVPWSPALRARPGDWAGQKHTAGCVRPPRPAAGEGPAEGVCVARSDQSPGPKISCNLQAAETLLSALAPRLELSH